MDLKMPLQITNEGLRNDIEISEQSLAKGSGHIMLTGDDNQLRIEDTDFHLGLNLTMGNSCSLYIGRNLNCYNLEIYQANEANMKIGQYASFNGIVRLLMHEASNLTIGDSCLFADQVEVSTSDMHSIIDVENGIRRNPAKDIELGDNVWVGHRAMLLKGSRVGKGSIIGAATVLTGNVPENSIAAGNPARIVRQNVTWDFRLL